MDRTEFTSSASSGTAGLTQTENDDTLSEGCSEDILTLVEDVILRTLKKYSSQADSEDAKAVVETRLRGGSLNAEGEENPSADLGDAPPAMVTDSEDRALLTKLLEQVHDLRRNQTTGSKIPSEAFGTEVQRVPKPARGRSFERRRGREKPSSSTNEELRMVLEAAAMAAKAAADAAEAAAVSMTKNTEAMELILKSMKSSSQKRRKSRTNPASSDSSMRKAIVNSNRITHWLLGFMAVTTMVWRFQVVKVTKRVAGKLSNPFGYVGELFSSDEEPKEKDKESIGDAAENPNLLEKLQQIELPSILPDSDGKKKTDPPKPTPDKKEKQVENTSFSFRNFFEQKPVKD